ncbi:hypothetical protein Q9323_18435 [Pseudomonas fulva]
MTKRTSIVARLQQAEAYAFTNLFRAEKFGQASQISVGEGRDQ